MQRVRVATLPTTVRAVVFDFDGVMTDNRVVVRQDGEESVVCNRGDGWGVSRLLEEGLSVLVLSSETNRVVAARCRKLGIECVQGFRQKLSPLQEWLQKYKLDAESVVYVGNDENDKPCLEYVGCGIVVRDAHPSVIPSADIVLDQCGGHGAVREVCDLILQRLGR